MRQQAPLDGTIDTLQLQVDINQQLGHDPDLVFVSIRTTLIAYISGLVDAERVEREIIKPLTEAQPSIETLSSHVLTPELTRVDIFESLIDNLLTGFVMIAEQGQQQVLLANLISLPHRGIEKPETESGVRGPREGFTELLETNIALLRRRLKTDKIRMKTWQIGALTQTEVRMIYLDGIADQGIVDELTKRISAIHIDAVLESNYIEEMIRDHPFSIFPTMEYTERPDVVAGALLEGKVSIFTNNTPFVLLAPFQFWSAFQSSEDYYLMFTSATFIRLIRTLSIVLALLLPSLYVAITTFHPEMLPTNLLLSVAGAREASPFPALVEALIMEITFEALREAILRLPRVMGQTVSIVGALVIGQAVVQAGIVSTPMVIVVSVTGIASFMIPRYNMTFSIRILRLLLLLLAGTLGFVGILLGLFTLTIYLTGIRSVGVPYMGPIAPLKLKGLRDFLVRSPHWLINRDTVPPPPKFNKKRHE
ncbi:spore gernimation protein GerA [Paenibacillus pectinilyticus]|uniref:Spore gernimation protein GerA n=1 Tax=Paenibacillus pectinilyticus TaxID=512399 RepID=A0A1C1A5Y8_9BACL|nr:spore germination protein [Paenibacillus pectinilyticus]OCT15965.1 spore gernimation protein GerA [Paenibacillus pectinilyticus]